jgi:acyl-CoA reductase-like NAD-dependent aldehyde dehydrogenase
MVTETAAQMFVGGEWRDSLTGQTSNATSPATGETIGTVPEGSRDDAVRAIAAAREAAPAWQRLTAFERAAKMHAVGDLIESRREELARTLTLDQGKPLRTEAYGEVDELGA